VHDKKQRPDRSYPNTERAREGEFRSTRRFSVFSHAGVQEASRVNFTAREFHPESASPPVSEGA